MKLAQSLPVSPILEAQQQPRNPQNLEQTAPLLFLGKNRVWNDMWLLKALSKKGE